MTILLTSAAVKNETALLNDIQAGVYDGVMFFDPRSGPPFALLGLMTEHGAQLLEYARVGRRNFSHQQVSDLSVLENPESFRLPRVATYKSPLQGDFALVSLDCSAFINVYYARAKIWPDTLNAVCVFNTASGLKDIAPPQDPAHQGVFRRLRNESEYLRLMQN